MFQVKVTLCLALLRGSWGLIPCWGELSCKKLYVVLHPCPDQCLVSVSLDSDENLDLAPR